jgi:hypothetical protein
METGRLGELHRLVEQIRSVTDASLPDVLAPDAPVLGAEGLDKAEFYLVGIIGGKNVGKSALVNALAGREITAQTSSGPGTSRVIAYAHASRAEALRELLEREVGDQYEIVTHEDAGLTRQVLLDLPDFDSHYTTHLEITRRMLRHMLYPVWIQSVEKYADRQPRELLARVTAGNDPRNFVFCLNKVDQLEALGEASAAQEIRADYAGRLRETLRLAEPPRVWLISALSPERYELPALRAKLMRERSEETVEESKEFAASQQLHSLVDWIDQQRLPERLDRVRRLESQAQEEVAARVAGPVIERAVTAIAGDATWAASVTDETMRRRVARWPILNALQLLLEPAMAALRGRVIPTARGIRGTPAQVVAQRLAELPEPLALTLQGTFAQLQQASPLASRLYADQRLWERGPAEAHVAAMQSQLSALLEARAEAVRNRLSRRGNPLRGLLRFLLTIGAAVWFVAAQPFLELYLLADRRLERIALILVQIFSVTYLLRSLLFLGGYYLFLWLALRWRTQQRVESGLRRRSRREGDLVGELNSAVLEWVDELLSPIRRAREQLESLIAQAGRFRGQSGRAAA